MDRVLLSHGSGGEETHRLIKSLFIKYFSNEELNKMEDSAILKSPTEIAFTTDSFVVSPIFFKGGDIGKLSVAGTVNDLAVMGAKPLYMSCSFIIEEGLSLLDLERIVVSMALEAEKSGVKIVTGDTKVVPNGFGDKVYITTSGIGKVVYRGLSAFNLEEGDCIIVSGTVGDHGACIFSQREGIDLFTELSSDCASIWKMVEPLFESGVRIKAMRDPTRGGLAGVLNDWAESSGVEIEVNIEDIPVRKEVNGICEFLGFEPYYLPNEGMVVIAVEEKDTERTLEILKGTDLGKESKLIGRVLKKAKGRVVLRSPYGARVVIEKPSGELLPRIC
ncbi:MAG: hydrogenase expression/formation protein HypE [Hydrogenothermaceae bacterium]|nr:hydrogenase expression/formation protein HypE [Hydrogenothermaceae bacterium]